MPSSSLHTRLKDINWAALPSLHLRARVLADGLFVGSHRSRKHGTGVEFAGYREYTPGDDPRQLDRRALMRFDRALVRLLEADTDRALQFVVDASASMAYGGGKEQLSKWEYASLLVAAFARLTLRKGDPVSLAFVGGKGATYLPLRAGRQQFERVVAALEHTDPYGESYSDESLLLRAISNAAQRAQRGGVMVLVSDFMDTHPALLDHFLALQGRGQALLALQVRHRDEVELPFEGPTLFESAEGELKIQTNPEAVRADYLEKLKEHDDSFMGRLHARGGRLVSTQTHHPPQESMLGLLDPRQREAS